MVDDKIIELYFSRSESAVAETQKKYGKYCYFISYRILSDRQDAEECVNDTYMRAWNSMPPHRPERLSAFLGKITRNLSIDRFKKKNTAKRANGSLSLALDELGECIPDISSADISDDVALRDALNSFLRSLPDETRVMFVQRYWYLYSVKEIAAAHSAGESKIKTQLMRTRQKLKEHLEKEGISL